MKRLTLVACAAALAIPSGGAMAADGGAASAGSVTAAACNSVSYDGRGYVLYRKGGVRCKFAKRWVRRLHNSAGQNKPSGWKCTSGSKFRTGGNCTKGAKAFGWHPGD